MAGARLAALPAGQVPEVGAAAVTALALHVGQAVALPAVPVTVALLGPTGAGVSAQGIAGTTWNQEAPSRYRDEGMRTGMEIGWGQSRSGMIMDEGGSRMETETGQGWRWNGSSMTRPLLGMG